MKVLQLLSILAFCSSSVSAISRQQSAHSLADSDQQASYKAMIRSELKEPIMSALDLKWDYTAKEISDLSKEAIKMANETINALVAHKGPRTYQNTVEPLS